LVFASEPLPTVRAGWMEVQIKGCNAISITLGSVAGQLFVALVSHKTSGDSAGQQATSSKRQATSA